MTYYGFEGFKTSLGTDAANAIMDFEASHLQHYIDLVTTEDIDCDLHATRACDVYLEDEEATAQKRNFRMRQAEHPEFVNVKGDMHEIEDVQELERISGVKGGKWGLTVRYCFSVVCSRSHTNRYCISFLLVIFGHTS